MDEVAREDGLCEDGGDPGEPEAGGVAVGPHVWDAEDDGAQRSEAREVDGAKRALRVGGCVWERKVLVY